MNPLLCPTVRTRGDFIKVWYIKMAKYKKIPTVIDAVKITNDMSLYDLACELEVVESPFFVDELEDGVFVIATLAGEMKAHIGDYIIKGIENELYPCKSSIFDQTYEKV